MAVHNRYLGIMQTYFSLTDKVIVLSGELLRTPGNSSILNTPKGKMMEFYMDQAITIYRGFSNLSHKGLFDRPLDETLAFRRYSQVILEEERRTKSRENQDHSQETHS